MAVKLTSGGTGLAPLTSPPKAPQPVPDSAIIAKVMDYKDRKVWVSIPFPDRITLITDILNEITAVPDLSLKSPKAKYVELDEDLKASVGKEPLDGGGPIVLDKLYGIEKRTAVFEIQYNPNDPVERAHFKLSRRLGDDYPIWSVRLEFNPSKAGPAGLANLREAVQIIAPFLDFPKLLGAFTVSRVDAAIDCTGVVPLDLIAHIQKPGKRMVYLSDSGRPETVYLYERKAPPKEPPKKSGYRTTGTHRLTLYERRDYQKQIAQVPTYGDCPVTRAEVVRKWGDKRPALADLANVSNLFVGRRVAYAAQVPGANKWGNNWPQFCLSAFGAGIERTTWAWLLKRGAEMAACYHSCPGDLVADDNWAGWPAGIASTGLSEWVDQAKIAAAALFPSVPSP